MSGKLDIRFPEDQQEGTEAIVLKWLKAPGEIVAAHEPVAEIETDKVVVEVTAPADGTLGEIHLPEGEPAMPGDLLCTLMTGTMTTWKCSATSISASAPHWVTRG